MIALVILARSVGYLQVFECAMLDRFLRLRPEEPLDERILVVGIDEKDIQQIGSYPIPDRDLARLLSQLETYQPNVIGLDLFRDLSVEPGHAALVKIFQQNQNIIGIEKALPDLSDATINPPPDLPPQQIGFVDALLDQDGKLRRSLLGTEARNISGQLVEQYKLSLSLQLAGTYLQSKGIALENGIRDPDTVRFGKTELVRFFPDFGSYANEDAGGTQVMLNFRSGQTPFRIVSMRDVLTGKVPADWIRDRIILIGARTLSAGDRVNTTAVHSRNPGWIYGVEAQAHAVSQITSAVLDQRPMLKAWAEGWETVWILGWGLLSLGLAQMMRSPLKALVGLLLSCLFLVLFSYGLLALGWWIPIVPSLLALGLGFTATVFYQYQQTLNDRLRERQFIIDQTFNAIHNGPLQILAGVLRDLPEEGHSLMKLQTDLKRLNHELRTIYDFMQNQAAVGNQLYLSGGQQLELQHPIHEVLYEVYQTTLSRDFPNFKTIKFRVDTFKALGGRSLTLDDRRGLCRFLEEALCNVGKHASGTTRLEVICTCEQGQNLVCVVDNGLNPLGDRPREGQGTRQAKALAQRLNGRFCREAASPQGNAV